MGVLDCALTTSLLPSLCLRVPGVERSLETVNVCAILLLSFFTSSGPRSSIYTTRKPIIPPVFVIIP